MQSLKTFFGVCGRRQTIYAVLVLMVTGLYSCKRDISKKELLYDREVMTYSDAFDAFWKGINSHYLFWDQETMNWDSVYRAYKPRFDSLDKRPYSDTTTNICFQYMVDMTSELKDGQYALGIWSGGNFKFDDSLYKSYITFIPKSFRAERIHAALPDTLFDHIMQNNYLNNFDYGVYRNFTTGQIFQIITGKVSKGAKNVIYANLNNFGLKESYNTNFSARPTRPVIKNLFDNIHKSNCDGLIIDLRNNRGGNSEDIDFLVGQFTTSPVLYGYARYKSGSGRLDYTPPLAMHVNPQPGATDFNKPIVILTDIFSASLCESVVLAFKALQQTKVTVIGERTYGTAGLMIGNEISTNGGSFDMGSFGSVRLSNAAMEDKDHHFNLSGIKPDIEVKYNAASVKQMLQSGIDIQMEKAIQFLNQ